jgi:Ca2+-transporting ATPase
VSLTSPTLPPASDWHLRDAAELAQAFQVNLDQGLSPSEAQARLAQYGLNQLVEKARKTVFSILWEQLTAPLVLILVFAAVVSLALGKLDSFVAIVAIIILNAILGVTQEYRAEEAMAALQRMTAPIVRVRRGGEVQELPSPQLVPGDVVLLEAGNVIPADCRLYEVANFQVQEASLTGESYPVEKTAKILTGENLPLGDRKNMAYMGTSSTNGRAVALVTATGMNTELGKIAELIQNTDDGKTPLQQRMDEVGKVLLGVAIFVMFLAFGIGLLGGNPWRDILIEAVAIAVAVVPEGLPAVVTVCLALGAQRMLARRALIRKLPAVETLGSVTTICSDKTGTLTENLMTVRIIDVAGRTEDLGKLDLTKLPYTFAVNTDEHEPHLQAQNLLLTAGALCNNSTLQETPENGTIRYSATGDPTESALAVAAAYYGLIKDKIEALFPRTGEAPFSSDRKRMTTIHRFEPEVAFKQNYAFLHKAIGDTGQKMLAFSKGAVDSLLEVSDKVWLDGQILPMTPEYQERITAQNNRFAAQGLRVLGMAFRLVEQAPADDKWESIEAEMVFVGMVGIIDPPREEVHDAVLKCQKAGIRVVMITGDHPLTAKSIARDLDIISEEGEVITGHQLNKMSQEELEAKVETVSVYARVSPEHKLQIVRALQNRGHIASMTGDGVNDAPALKQASIGVAMGITGTDVTKQASDMVILDDNFTTIVSAVEEGRTIYDNVRRFIKYLLASNTGELFVLLTSQLAALGLPLTTLQILWMNLITDGIPALALGVEKSEPGVMKRAPYAPNESVFGRGMARHIIIVGLLMGLTGLGLGYWAFHADLRASNGDVAWNSMVFLFLTISQMGHALGLRSHRESLFSLNFFGNPFLLAAVIFTVILQTATLYIPFFNDIFNTAPLTLEQYLLCMGLSLVVFVGVEVEKLLLRRGLLKNG